MLLLFACAPAGIEFDDPDDSAGPDAGDVEHLPATDTDTAEEPEEEEAHPERIFALDTLHTVDFTLDDGALRSLRNDPYTFVSGDLVFDGEPFPTVGVRIKGRLGSLRDMNGKPALKVDFDVFGVAQELEGLDALNLNNMVQDCSQVHELAAYQVFRAMGIPAPRVGYAWVTVNGEDYGVYSIIEEYDDEFLDANFDDPTGNLYDGDYYLHGDGSYTLLDFSTASQDYFELDEGLSVGLADIHAVTEAVAASGGTSRFQQDVGALLSLDQHARFLAVNAWTGQYDSYSYYSNNYRVYFDPADGGRAMMMPWDPDWAFYQPTPVTSPYSLVSYWCYHDATCYAAARSAMDEIDTAIAREGVWEDVEAAKALVNPVLPDDPRRETGMPDIRWCQDDLESWFSRRAGEMAGF